ncbi:Na+/H+ antiporter subunit E [Desulfofustis limnaeus]|jgi:multicomponent Na+:H+ antiporter subunit E|nr:Na+/H+ antiporter subunit E [Desulfofustis limnaeus]MDX9894580.1 Na+/H+ antiporter subunit E [Desulfofustis sp.]
MAFVPICTVFCLFRACRKHIDGVHTGGIMRHVLALSTLLSAFWLINSGHYTPLILFFMVVSVALVVSLCNRLDVVDGESQPLNLTFSIPGYWLWLIKEVVVSNLAVAANVWRGTESISPRLITITANQKTDIGKVIYANSITLTPGTVSVDLEGDKIVVHALTKESAAGLLTGDMDRRVCLVER